MSSGWKLKVNCATLFVLGAAPLTLVMVRTGSSQCLSPGEGWVLALRSELVLAQLLPACCAS